MGRNRRCAGRTRAFQVNPAAAGDPPAGVEEADLFRQGVEAEGGIQEYDIEGLAGRREEAFGGHR